MIQYSGGTLINRTFTPATRADWVNNVTQAVSDAGWTTISGTPGSGSDVTLETPTQLTAGTKIRFRFFDPGSGNCAQTTMKNVAGSLTSNIAYALPSAGTIGWRVIAAPYHFFAFPSGSVNVNVARGFVAGGTLWTPSFLGLASTDPVGWLIISGTTDTDATTRFSLRRTFCNVISGNSPYGWSALWQTNLVQASGGGGNVGDMTIAAWQNSLQTSDAGYRWIDNSVMMYEPFLCWATGNSVANEARLKGQLYDAMVVNGFWAGESTISFDNHTWINITDGPTVSLGRTNCLFLAVT